MGRDEEVPTQFGMLHGRTLSPHRAVWFLAIISIFFGILTTVIYLGERVLPCNMPNCVGTSSSRPIA